MGDTLNTIENPKLTLFITASLDEHQLSIATGILRFIPVLHVTSLTPLSRRKPQ
jgi:hypothetical protein